MSSLLILESSRFIEAKLSKTEESSGTSVGVVEDELKLFSSVQFVIVTHSTITLSRSLLLSQKAVEN